MPKSRPQKDKNSVIQKQPAPQVQGERLIVKDKNGSVVGELRASTNKGASAGFLELFNTIGGKSSRGQYLSGTGDVELGDDDSPVQLSSSESRQSIRSGEKIRGKIKAAIEIDGDDCRITFYGLESRRLEINGSEGNIWLGGNGVDGDLVLFSKTETDVHNAAKSAIHLDGETSRIALNFAGNPRVLINGDEGNLRLGGNGADGDLLLFPKTAKDLSNSELASIHLDGDAGDIILRNADCAEDFDVVSKEAIEPGTVMVLEASGRLQPSQTAYDTKVAGIVSGAGGYKPGLLLDKQPEAADRQPIALMGKVFCKVDAQYGPIEVGDLLTTSPTPGCAMKASDPLRAFGAILGKALKPFTNGTGLIPILASLQ